MENIYFSSRSKVNKSYPWPILLCVLKSVNQFSQFVIHLVHSIMKHTLFSRAYI